MSENLMSEINGSELFCSLDPKSNVPEAICDVLNIPPTIFATGLKFHLIRKRVTMQKSPTKITVKFKSHGFRERMYKSRKSSTNNKIKFRIDH